MANAMNSASDLDAMTLEEKVGQLVVARFPDWPLMEKYAARGIITGLTPQLSERPIEEAAELLNHMQQVSKYPLIFGWSGICYHGGTDLRLNHAMRISATRSKELAYLAGKIEATEARAVGFHLGAAPNLDVNTNPDNPIINLRSFSDNADLVIELGVEIARGVLDGRALTIAMHFPGHGSTATDSHIGIALAERSLEELEEVDMKTFRAGIAQNVLKTVCTNHCHYPAFEPDRKIPATISRKIITELLREKLGYDGVIFSDSLTMRAIKEPYGIEEGAILAVRAGHDLILQDSESDPQITLDALVKAVRDGRIPLEQIEASLRRVVKLKEWLGLFEDRFVDAEKVSQIVGTDEHKAVAKRIARESVTVLENKGMPPASGSNGTCLVVSNSSVATIEEDLGIPHTPANEFLNQCVLRRMPNARTAAVGVEPNPVEIKTALDLAKDSEIVIFGLFTRVRAYAEHGIRLQPEYVDLIKTIASMRCRTVYLSLGNPWNIVELPRPDMSLCMFSDAEDSIEAAMEVLFGEIKAKGKLPVTLSKEYPFGYGL